MMMMMIMMEFEKKVGNTSDTDQLHQQRQAFNAWLPSMVVDNWRSHI